MRRLVRPVTSATISVPNRVMMASSTAAIGGSAQSCSTRLSRSASASGLVTGWPLSSNSGRERTSPVSSRKKVICWTGNARVR